MDQNTSDEQRRAAIASRVRERRKALGLTQEAVAVQAGVSKSFMSELEGGTTIANGLIYLRIAKALGVGVQWLLAGEANEQVAPPADPLRDLPIVSKLAEKHNWTHRKALDVATAASRVAARRSGPGKRWQPTAEFVLRLAEAMDPGDEG